MLSVGDKTLHYEILDQLGKGGMGQVFRALDTKLEREVALKFILNPESVPDHVKDRLIIEAKAAAKLDHPNIGVLHAIEQTGEDLFLVLTLYEGQSLEDKLLEGPLSLEDCKDITLQVLQGLQHAHAKHVVHRDIKPGNIFITIEGVVKILDFGLARMPESNLTLVGQIIGTPAYCSPEQLQDTDVDARADIWSLGVLFFQLLTGQLPFEGKFPQVLVAVLKQEPKMLEPFTSHKALRDILVLSLAKDKHERYPNCDAFMHHLETLETNENIPVSEAPQANLVTPSSSGRPRLSLIGRDEEQKALTHLLSDKNNILVSIVGMGGAGKTSLAKSTLLSTELSAVYNDGIHFIALEAVQDTMRIPSEIANALGLSLKGLDAWLELSTHLMHSRCLLILDNLEHLINDCAAELDLFLTNCDYVTILATSREVLNLTGEVVFELSGLSIPTEINSDFEPAGLPGPLSRV